MATESAAYGTWCSPTTSLSSLPLVVGLLFFLLLFCF